jgi:hypothetical protein
MVDATNAMPDFGDPKAMHELSSHPAQQLLRMSKGHAYCARAVTTHEQQALAESGKYTDIFFTPEQEKGFACQQIILNKTLQSHNLPPLRLLHLSARMLLDPTSSTKPQAEKIVPSDEPVLPEAKERKTGKRKSRNKNKTMEVSAAPFNKLEAERDSSIGQIAFNGVDCDLFPRADVPAHDGQREISENDHMLPVTPPHASCEAAASLTDAPSDEPQQPYVSRTPTHLSIPVSLLDSTISAAAEGDGAQAVTQLCAAYEEILLTQREQYEELQQSLNLRLFIAQTEVEALREKLLLAQQDRRP